ncbi:MAG: hypothetical protein IT373_35395 [Polyangiaceae bacterium]|nr:hypothetical protein [Polyangiaceae bacterium]
MAPRSKPREQLARPDVEALVLKQGCWARPSAGIFQDWRDRPADPDDLLAKKRRIRRALVIGRELDFVSITEVLNAGVPSAFRITWQELTRFNWGTAEPAEVNWYLWYYLAPYIRRTHDRQNYRFKCDPVDQGVDYQNPALPCQFIWIPDYQHARPTRHIPAEREKTIVIDDVGCAYRVRGGDKCQRLPGQPMCHWARVRAPMAPDYVQNLMVPEEHRNSSASIELQNIAIVGLTVQRWRVWRRAPSRAGDATVVFSPTSNETITRIYIDYRASDYKGRDARVGGGSSPMPPQKVAQLPEHALRGQDGLVDLAAVAKSVRDLYAIDKLDGLTIRAYEDRSTPRTLQDREAFTNTRARWLFDKLRTDYRLPLVLDDPAQAAETALLVKRGFVPVRVFGCGAGDALVDVNDPDHRVALFEYTPKAAAPPGEIAEQEGRFWEVYEREVVDAQDPTKTRVLSMVYSSVSRVVARDDAALTRFRAELSPYLFLMGQAADEERSAALAALLAEQANWSADTASELEGLLASDKLTARFMTPCISDMTLRELLGQWVRGVHDSAGHAPWLASDENAEPNHRLDEEPGGTISCDFTSDELKKFQQAYTGAYTPHYRVRFA